jgi:hypothetical protein
LSDGIGHDGGGAIVLVWSKVGIDQSVCCCDCQFLKPKHADAEDGTLQLGVLDELIERMKTGSAFRQAGQ